MRILAWVYALALAALYGAGVYDLLTSNRQIILAAAVLATPPVAGLWIAKWALTHPGTTT